MNVALVEEKYTYNKRYIHYLFIPYALIMCILYIFFKIKLNAFNAASPVSSI